MWPTAMLRTMWPVERAARKARISFQIQPGTGGRSDDALTGRPLRSRAAQRRPWQHIVDATTLSIMTDRGATRLLSSTTRVLTSKCPRRPRSHGPPAPARAERARGHADQGGVDAPSLRRRVRWRREGLLGATVGGASARWTQAREIRACPRLTCYIKPPLPSRQSRRWREAELPGKFAPNESQRVPKGNDVRSANFRGVVCGSLALASI